MKIRSLSSPLVVSGLVLVLLAMVVVVSPVLAQDRQAQHIYVPMASPAASVSQTIGVTEISITYHRPAVNEREIWGSLVPYDQMWRTGANENTVISFSTPVKVQGQDLAAGSYGLLTIPGKDEWTYVFSHNTHGWGNFGYNQDKDALRVTTKPVEVSSHQERMAFTFEEVSNESTEVHLRWAKLAVPLKVEADTHNLALASFREQLTGLSAFFWQGWNQAASYCLQNDVDYEQGLKWANQSIQVQENFSNLSTKAQLLEKTGKGDEAKEIMANALGKGNAGELFGYARGLIGQGKAEEALEIFKRNVKQNPEAWFVELGVARAYSALGQFDKAVEQMKITVERSPENNKEYIKGLLSRLEKGEDIN